VAEVRVEHRPPQPALVSEREAAAVVELDREAIPDRLVVRGFERDGTGHPEMQSERRPVLRRQPEELSTPMRADELVADERRRELSGLMGAADVRVAVVDAGDPLAQHRLQRHAGSLGFREFGYAVQRTSTPRPRRRAGRRSG